MECWISSTEGEWKKAKRPTKRKWQIVTGHEELIFVTVSEAYYKDG